MSSKKEFKPIKAKPQANSSLADFIERPVPSEQEVVNFNRAVKQEVRDQEIDTNLSEIYKDRYGQLMDVKTLKVKKRRSWLARFSRFLLGLIILVGLSYGAYYFINRTNNQAAAEISLKAPESVIAGEEFSYEVSYKNTSRFALNKINLDLKYPDNFIFLESSIPPASQNSNWQLPDLAPGQSYSLTVKGKLINKKDAPNILEAYLTYTPANFSSEFKRDASVNTLIGGLGFDVEAAYLNTALIGQDGEVNLIFNNFGDNVFLNNFVLNVSSPNNIVISDITISPEIKATEIKNVSRPDINQTPPYSSVSITPMAINKISGSQWQIDNVAAKSLAQKVLLKYKVNEKTEDKQSIVINLEQLAPDGRTLIFWEKTIDLDIMKSDLNLTLAVDNLKADSAVDFGQTLNYTINYANHGVATLKDVNIRVDLKGEFFDWNSLQDKNRGQLSDGGIIWTKEQIPGLAEISPNQEGAINFSIKLNDFTASDLGKDLSLNNQASFNLSGGEATGSSSDRLSNTIINKINSNLNLIEQIRYFDENNIPVGSGPLPPKVGEKTSFKIYWSVTNDLHELSDTKVSLVLPNYVNFEEKSSVNVGSLIYDNSSRQIT
ncbi:MAG: hypothetical protein NTX66_00490, partial [Candidatus Falkowbacteria bacterium]|nr:hypothetical protein [Candidatus Falkowbacteria bacterium]